MNNILKSVRKTKRLLVLDTGFPYGSIASEITSLVSRKLFKILKFPPQIMTMPDIPEPTSLSLIEDFYITAESIAKSTLNILKIKYNNNSLKKLKNPNSADVPDPDFKGPF